MMCIVRSRLFYKGGAPRGPKRSFDQWITSSGRRSGREVARQAFRRQGRLALLYLGDGHAAQGDGELNGNALETSLDVEFIVDVIPGKGVRGPRVESATHIMAMG